MLRYGLSLPFWLSLVLSLRLLGILLPCIKYVWIHLFLHAALVFHGMESETFKEGLYLMLILPLAFTTAAGHCMQLSANTYQEAYAMEALSMVMELGEYYVS